MCEANESIDGEVDSVANRPTGLGEERVEEQDLEQAQKQRAAYEESVATQQSNWEARKQELQAAHTEAERQVQGLAEALAVAAERREAIKLRAAEYATSRGEVGTRPEPRRSSLQEERRQRRVPGCGPSRAAPAARDRSD